MNKLTKYFLIGIVSAVFSWLFMFSNLFIFTLNQREGPDYLPEPVIFPGLIFGIAVFYLLKSERVNFKIEAHYSSFGIVILVAVGWLVSYVLEAFVFDSIFRKYVILTLGFIPSSMIGVFFVWFSVIAFVKIESSKKWPGLISMIGISVISILIFSGLDYLLSNSLLAFFQQISEQKISRFLAIFGWLFLCWQPLVLLGVYKMISNIENKIENT